jgi:hypothetical protein
MQPRAFSDRRAHHVQHLIVTIDGLEDIDRPEAAGIEGLTSGRGVEGAAIEQHAWATLVLDETSHNRIESAA